MLERVKSLIPPLSGSQSKGDLGRICVIGGSADYTGAPYFAGISSVRTGSDYAFVLTTPSAAVPIKTYSPDLICSPVLPEDSTQTMDEDKLDFFLSRSTAVCLGPGLGRGKRENVVNRILEETRERRIPLVIDADGLYDLERDLVSSRKDVVLTPNNREFRRLYKKVTGKDTECDPADVKELAKTLKNLTILKKGERDIVSDGVSVYEIGEENGYPGSPRRVAGQGDILAGVVSTFLSWSSITLEGSEERALLSAIAGSMVARKVAEEGYKKKKRGLITTDLIDLIPQVFDSFSPVP